MDVLLKFEKMAEELVPKVQFTVQTRDSENDATDYLAVNEEFDAAGIGRTKEEAVASAREYLTAYFLANPSVLRKAFRALRAAQAKPATKSKNAV